ncbi:MAG: glycosyltransferase family 39 protein [Acidimicrobiia bacterium]|nr:glycosyltransferase family 39 protein [Acidimicrobiia bacterium]
MLLGGLAMYGLLVRARLRSPAALFGALAWMLNSFFLTWMALEHIIVIEAWLPVALLLLDVAIRRRSWWASVGVGAALALMFLGGNLLFFELAAVAVFGYGLVLVVPAWARSLRERSVVADRRTLLGDLGRLLLPAAVLVGLVAAQLLPTLLLARSSGRASLGYSELREYRLHPRPAPQLLPPPTPPAAARERRAAASRVRGRGDLPVAGDWDGDGRDHVGVFRGGTFVLRSSLDADDARRELVFGEEGDLPVAGDWDGDGRDDVGVFRDGVFLLRTGDHPSGLRVALGEPGDTPWPATGTATAVTRSVCTGAGPSCCSARSPVTTSSTSRSGTRGPSDHRRLGRRRAGRGGGRPRGRRLLPQPADHGLRRGGP